MKQFDVVRMHGGDRVVILQSDILDYLSTRLVAPLLAAERVPSLIRRLNPQLKLGNDDLILATHLAATVPLRQLQRVEATLIAYEYEIKAALDMLISGF